MWAAAPEVDRDGVSVEHTIIITDLSRSICTNTSTTNTTFTTSLQFDVPHLITLYTSTCGHTLISDNFTTNITIDKCEELEQIITIIIFMPDHSHAVSCPLPPMTPGVEVITIGEGVIAYQCEEGLVPEGRVEAMCGDDGRWSPNLTQHMCNDSMNSSASVTNNITRQDTCIVCLTTASANIIEVIVGSSVSSVVVLVVVLLVIVLLMWKVSKKCT